MLRCTAVYFLLLLLLDFVVSRESFHSFRVEGDHRDVETNEGVVRGRFDTDGDYVVFLGVPYAAPPTGVNRFRAPSPPRPWKGIYEANRVVRCPQRGDGNEDCLVANIFTPVIFNGSLPVLVYIHGGSFLIGSGQTEGVENLIKQNIIVVTVNYRVGALGFLCLGIDEATGNAGLKDQVAALKWVRNNIANFGGDPHQVTVYGMSAGASSVEMLILSNNAEVLFQRAIVESGSATTVFSIDADPIATALNVAAALNSQKKIRNLHELVDYYKQVPANILSTVTYDYYNSLTDGTFGFVPCIENNISNNDAFITESPYDILIKEKFVKIPMIFSFATLEGLFLRSQEYYEQNYKERMQSNFVNFLPADLIFDNYEIRKHVARKIKSFYFYNKTINDDDIVDYLNYFGDYLIMHGLLNSVEIHSRNNNSVYLIEFAYRGNMGSSDSFYENMTVAGHGDMIKHIILNKPIISDEDKLAVDRVSKLVANFVKFGNPIPEQTPLLPILWPAVRPDNVSFLHLDKEFQVSEKPHWNRKVFWDQLYAQYRRRTSPVDTDFL